MLWFLSILWLINVVEGITASPPFDLKLLSCSVIIVKYKAAFNVYCLKKNCFTCGSLILGA